MSALFISHIRLGDALNLMGRYDEAEQHLRKAVEIREASVGTENPETAAALVRLADVLRNKGDEPQARDLLARAYPIQVKGLGLDESATLETRQLLETQP